MKYGALIITFIFGFIITFGTIFVFDHLFHTPADDIENQMVINAIDEKSCRDFRFSDVSNGTFTIPVRTFWNAYSFEDDVFMTEFDSKPVFKDVEFRKNNIALVVIDVWDYNYTYNRGFYYRTFNTTKNITKIVDFARDNDIPIIYSYNMYKSYINPIEGEYVVNASNSINDDIEMSIILKNNNITMLFYVGYATNMCILFNPTGMIKMHNSGFDTIIMRDGTTALETNFTIENEYAKDVSVRMIETQYEGSCVIEDFISGYGD